MGLTRGSGQEKRGHRGGADGKSAFVPSGKECPDACLTHVLPNAELTGRRRVDSLAVRPMMTQGGCTAKLASRWRSG